MNRRGFLRLLGLDGLVGSVALAIGAKQPDKARATMMAWVDPEATEACGSYLATNGDNIFIGNCVIDARHVNISVKNGRVHLDGKQT